MADFLDFFRLQTRSPEKILERSFPRFPQSWFWKSVSFIVEIILTCDWTSGNSFVSGAGSLRFKSFIILAVVAFLHHSETRLQGPSSRHCARVTQLFSKKCRCGDKPSATTCRWNNILFDIRKNTFQKFKINYKDRLTTNYYWTFANDFGWICWCKTTSC